MSERALSIILNRGWRREESLTTSTFPAQSLWSKRFDLGRMLEAITYVRLKKTCTLIKPTRHEKIAELPESVCPML